MAIVPTLPSNGQPIDTQYIYDIVNSLISINNEISSIGQSHIKVGTQSSSNVSTNKVNIDAQTVNIVTSATVAKKTPQSGQIAFTSQFSQTPVVTLSLVSKSTTAIGATVTITGVDTSAVYYKVTFDGDGTTTLDLNVIAVGV